MLGLEGAVSRKLSLLFLVHLDVHKLTLIASLTGWALVYRHEAKEFARQWQHAYDEKFSIANSSIGLIREFFMTHPGQGAFCV